MTQAALADFAPAVAGATAACFHCGLPLDGRAYPVLVDGVNRDTCCHGCQAVAGAIAGLGLDAYYRKRSTLSRRSRETAGAAGEAEVYDLPEVQRTFVRECGAGSRALEANLLLDGITCAACIWLIEQRLMRLPGVSGASINYAARRARVQWDPRVVRLSAILRAIAELGYGAQPYDVARSDQTMRRERRAMLWRLFIAGFGMMQVMMYAVPAYIADGAMSADVEQLMRWASLILTTPVALWAALPFHAGAWRDLKSRRAGMDVPVSAGIVVAFTASLFATLQGTGTVYFDSVSMFVFLLLAARYLELRARSRVAEEQDRLVRGTPAVAERLDRFPVPIRQDKVAAASLQRGDYVLVRPGTAVPADGCVVDGMSAVDESLLTGESRPIAKRAGDRLTGGAINLHGPLTMRVERVGEDTALAGIVRLMDRAQTEKPRIAEVADRVASWFVAALLALTAIVAIAWYAIDPARALWVAVALLVVTCPCALALATPAALVAATGRLYRCGVLVARGHALETLARATHYVFDKTGTLTQGKMTLVGVLPLRDEDRARCLAMAATLEAQSEHPIGRAIAAAAADGWAREAVSSVLNAPGKGVEGRVNGRRMRIGSPDFVAELTSRPLPDDLLFVSDDVTAVALGDERGWIALFTLGDALRPGARRVVAELRRLGKTVCLLSGDRTAAVQRMARELGIENALGGASPQDKLEFVRMLQAQGAVVAMIGDGVNDAPVLGQAQVSLALAGGTELAQSSADVVLMSERLDPLIDAAVTARRALRVIRENLGWAVVYNAIALPLAAFGQVTPLVAAAGMSLSSLTVVLNALRLLGHRSSDAPPAAGPSPELRERSWISSTS